MPRDIHIPKVNLPEDLTDPFDLFKLFYPREQMEAFVRSTIAYAEKDLELKRRGISSLPRNTRPPVTRVARSQGLDAHPPERDRKCPNDMRKARLSRSRISKQCLLGIFSCHSLAHFNMGIEIWVLLRDRLRFFRFPNANGRYVYHWTLKIPPFNVECALM
jgi:hypothetical protein